MIGEPLPRAARSAPAALSRGEANGLSTRRIARFGAVGAAGFVWQAGLACLLVGACGADAVWAWVVSTEAAVLHNFVLHVRWTWADRPVPARQLLGRLVRFNSANGAISIVGGAIVMRVTTGDLGLPFPIGLVVSVGLCALGNLLASEYWAFRGGAARGGEDRRRRIGRAAMVLVALHAFALPPRVLGADESSRARQAAFAEYMKQRDAAARERLVGTRPFLWLDDRPERRRLARSGALVIEPTQGEPATEVPDGLVHDWIGAVFIPGVTVRQVIDLVQDYDRHDRVYRPDVVDSTLISREGQHFVAHMRFRRKKIITVILDTVHDAQYEKLDETRWHSRSVTTSVEEVTNAGEPGERRLAADEGHGFMLNLNTFWRFAERDGGVYVECQAVSLSRRIPTGLGWLLGPMVYSLPRESLSHTLAATRAALVATPGATGK